MYINKQSNSSNTSQIAQMKQQQPSDLIENNKRQSLSMQQNILSKKQSIMTDGKRGGIMNPRFSCVNIQSQFNEMLQKQFIKQQNIRSSINNLRGVISKNVSLRKGEDTSKPSTLANTKFFSNLAGIKNHYQQKIENKDLLQADSKNKFYNKGMQVNKSLRNLSIITQKTDNQNDQQHYGIKNRMKDEFQAHKPLYVRYFCENANNFIKSVQDPYNPKLRNKILKSDQEYDKFVQSYLSKVDLSKQKDDLKKNGSALKNTNTRNQFMFEGRDFLTLNKQQNEIEKNLIYQISDLDNFQEKHMIETLDKLQNGQILYPQKRRVSAQKTRMARVIQIENEKRKTQTASGFYRTQTTSSALSQGSGGAYFRSGFSRPPSTAGTSGIVGLSEIEKQQNQSSQPLQQQQQQQLQQQEQSQGHYFNQTYFNNQKLMKKLENQTKKGYHVIKRNQSEHALAYKNDDLVRDESDDSSNASRTEATLDNLYSESISIQNRLVSDNQDGLIRKLKQLIKLENLKKNVMDANLYKLERK